jgi:hypothetical protein
MPAPPQAGIAAAFLCALCVSAVASVILCVLRLRSVPSVLNLSPSSAFFCGAFELIQRNRVSVAHSRSSGV